MAVDSCFGRGGGFIVEVEVAYPENRGGLRKERYLCFYQYPNTREKAGTMTLGL